MALASLVAVLAVFTFGMVVVFPGSIKLRLAQRLSMSDTRIGRLIMAWQVTTMLVTLLVGPLLDRFGHRLLLVAGFLIVAAAIVPGLGGSCVTAGGNTLLPALNQDNPAAAALPAIPAAVASYPRISSGFEFAVALGLLANPVVLLAGLALFLLAFGL